MLPQRKPLLHSSSCKQAIECTYDEHWLVVDLLFREPNNSESPLREILVTNGIPTPRVGLPVSRTVNLDNESPTTPEQVDFVGPDRSPHVVGHG